MKTNNSDTLICAFCSYPLILMDNYCSDKQNIGVAKCSKCDLVQLEDFAHANLNEYIENYFDRLDLKEAREKESLWNKKRVNYLIANLPHIVNTNVLDFGSGHGGFLEAAQGKLENVIGFDLSTRLSHAHQKMGWKCFNSIDNVPDDIKIIVLFHVLEHINEPSAFFTKLLKRFKNVEYVVIEVPNTDESLNSIFNNQAYGKNHYSSDHLYYFTDKTLRKLLESIGFDVVFHTQLQRYSLANHFGWLYHNKGGGQFAYTMFNDTELNEQYEQVLVLNGIADSLFYICNTKEMIAKL